MKRLSLLIVSSLLAVTLLFGASIFGQTNNAKAASLTSANTTSTSVNNNCSGCSLVIASSGQLLARITVLVSVTAVCTLPAGATNFYDGSIFIQISQASDKQIVRAYGYVGLTMADCDGAEHTFQVAVTPSSPYNTSSSPLHGGQAVATGTLSFSYYDSFNYNYTQAYLSVGPQVIHI